MRIILLFLFLVLSLGQVPGPSNNAQCSLLQNAEFLFNDIQTTTAVNSDACCNFCASNDNCVVWTWDVTTNQCSIKDAETVLLSTATGKISGRKTEQTFSYIGCFEDNGERDLPIRRDANGMKPEVCAVLCDGYSFFALQYYVECFCGNSYGKYGKKSETDCNMQCSGAPSVMCGGTWRNSVYRRDNNSATFQSNWVDLINTDFSDQNLAGWSVTGTTTSPLAIGMCAGQYLMGGVGTLGRSTILHWKSSPLVSFNKIKVFFTFAFLDSWDDEYAWMAINGDQVWQRNHAHAGTTNLCGSANWGETFEEFEVTLDIESTGNLEITFGCSLDQNAPDESFALAKFRVAVIPQPLLKNIALNKPAKQSSNGMSSLGSADKAVDGNTDGILTDGSVALTGNELEPWWEVDLQGTFYVEKVVIFNRVDCCPERINPFHVDLVMAPSVTSTPSPAHFTTTQRTYVAQFKTEGVTKVRVQLDKQIQSTRQLQLAEVQVLGNGVTEETMVVTTLVGSEGNIGIYLLGSDVDDKSLSATITSMPASGTLVEVINDVRIQIHNVPYQVAHDLHRVTYEPNKNGMPGTENFEFIVTNTNGETIREITVSINMVTNTPYQCDAPTESSSVGGLQKIVAGEIHSLSGVNNVQKRMRFQNRYRNPVVIAQPLSYRGKDQAVLRIINVDNDGFDYFVQEAVGKDGQHVLEDTGFIVLEAGSWNIDGNRFVVGKTATSATIGFDSVNNIESWEVIQFPSDSFFSTVPIVFSQVQSNNDRHWVKTRQNHITTSSFRVSLEEEDSNEVTHGGEIVGWVAIEPMGKGVWDNRQYDIGSTGDNVRNNWYNQKFSTNFADVPIFIAMMQSYDNTGSTHLRYNNLDKNGVELSWFRDVGDTSRSSNSENVGYIAISSDGELHAISVDCSNNSFVTFDMNVLSNEGETIMIKLLEAENVGKAKVRIVEIPSNGMLYQFTGKSELNYHDAIIEGNTEVTDIQGRVVYKGYSSDFFRYQHERNSNGATIKSNVATVRVQVQPKPAQDIPSSTPTDVPQTPTQPSSGVSDIFQTNKTLIGLLVFAVVILILMTLAVFAFGFFLYKKKNARKEMISLFLGETDERGEQTYFPEELHNEEDSVIDAT